MPFSIARLLFYTAGRIFSAKYAELFPRELLALAMALRKREDQKRDKKDRIVTVTTVFCKILVNRPVSVSLPSLLPCRPLVRFYSPVHRG
jgi:hypothetical protein